MELLFSCGSQDIENICDSFCPGKAIFLPMYADYAQAVHIN